MYRPFTFFITAVLCCHDNRINHFINIPRKHTYLCLSDFEQSLFQISRSLVCLWTCFLNASTGYLKQSFVLFKLNSYWLRGFSLLQVPPEWQKRLQDLKLVKLQERKFNTKENSYLAEGKSLVCFSLLRAPLGEMGVTINTEE